LLAKAVAKALRFSDGCTSTIGGAFISLSCADIVRGEVGVSEKLVVSAFQTARANSPSVIFIDEFQALFTERSSGSSSRLTTTLLQCMDDVKRWSLVDQKGNGVDDMLNNDTRVLVLAATNTPWMIDRAFLRPGRFDRCVLVNLPNLDDRISILRLHTQRMKTSFQSESIERVTSFLTTLAQSTDGFSGADLAALCRAAAIRCLVEQAKLVQENHFFNALDEGLKASSSVSLVKQIEKWRP
jgi:SpoVK/Ycf46/Vps4 family AAA+-type ATPase